MLARVPGLSLEADPLITEAKQRARRRRLRIAGVAVVLAAGAAGAAVGLRSSGPSGLPLPTAAGAPSHRVQQGTGRRSKRLVYEAERQLVRDIRARHIAAQKAAEALLRAQRARKQVAAK